MLDTAGTIQAKAHQGLRASRLSGIARSVAISIVIAMSFGIEPAEGGQIDATKDTKIYISSIANYQLTDKQEDCHNEIIYRESRWDHRAIGNVGGTKQAYGLYQMKVKSLKTASTVKQFWMYWHYVTHRYGYTKYEEPNYCKALHHLKTKGWQ